jgi:hypothetical protein
MLRRWPANAGKLWLGTTWQITGIVVRSQPSPTIRDVKLHSGFAGDD